MLKITLKRSVKMKLVWVVSFKCGRYRQKIMWRSFNEAWECFKTDWESLTLIYPKLIKNGYWKGYDS